MFFFKNKMKILISEQISTNNVEVKITKENNSYDKSKKDLNLLVKSSQKFTHKAEFTLE